MARSASHNCLFCGEMFRADPRNARHQKYCSEPSCRKASKVASRRAWLAKPENQDYFRGPENVARVQSWRAAHPGYWRRPGGQRGGEDRIRRLRYKIAARGRGLKSLKILKAHRNLRYKISGAINQLF